MQTTSPTKQIVKAFFSHYFFTLSMRRTVTLLFALPLIAGSITIHAQDCPPSIQWEKSLGGAGIDRANVTIPTNDGGYIVVGNSNSTDSDVADNHGGPNDAWVAKLAASGDLSWERALGGTGDDRGVSIIQTNDDAYVVVGSSTSTDGDVTKNYGDNDEWVVKLNNSGTILWQHNLGGSAFERATSVEQTMDNGFIVAGFSNSKDSDVTGNHGATDFWIVKLDEGGLMVWEKSYGGSKGDSAYSIHQTPDGGYIVAGYAASSDSDVTGNHGGEDYWILKLDSSGNITWNKAFGGTKNDEAYSIQLTTDGGYIVTGLSYSDDGNVTGHHGSTDNSDFWVVKLDVDGNLLWEKSLGGDDIDAARSIQQVASGGYVVSGNTHSTNGDVSESKGGVDVWIVQIDSNGNKTWERSFGGSNNDFNLSIQQTSDGGFISGGRAGSNNGDVSGHIGGDDYWVIKLGAAPAGVQYYADADGDNYGDANNDSLSCTGVIAGYVTDNTDCNDANASVHPGATEISGNGIDDNCNGDIDEVVGIPSVTSSENLISLFPNPTDGKFMIELQLKDETNGHATIQVINALGQLMYDETTRVAKGILQKEIQLNEAANGVYMVKVIVNDREYSAQINFQK